MSANSSLKYCTSSSRESLGNPKWTNDLKTARTFPTVAPRLSVLLTLALLALSAWNSATVHAQVGPSGNAEVASPGLDPPAPDLVVRGSVEQIHVINAEPNVDVSVQGPNRFRTSASTDEAGGLVVRNVPAGSGYSVTVNGNDRDRHVVRVLNPVQHPDAGFYAAQELGATNGYVETRDGTLLSYRVVLPDADLHGQGPYDVIITYSGYQPSLETSDGYQNKPFDQFSEAGYAVVGVNMRGSGCSGGAFDFMEPLTWLDGYDVVEALAAQEWVDGVALGDQSWPGLTQLFVASAQPPSLDAIVCGSVVGDFYRDVFFPGGIPNIGFAHIWASARDAENAYPSRRDVLNRRAARDSVCAVNQRLRGQNVSLLETIQDHPHDGDSWQSRSAEPLVEKITVPVLQVVSWQDPQVGSRPAMLYERYAADTPVRVVGVNGFHQYWSGAVWDEVVQFLHTYLGGASEAAISEYETQNDIVVLLESDETGDVRGRCTLPNFGAGDGQRLKLGSDLASDEPGSVSTFNYDPNPPGSWTEPVQDQVAFTSDALPEDTMMAGPGSADLWIAADAEDVDLQVTLSEIRPDGQEMLVQSGWLRASHRTLDDDASTPLRPRQLHTAESLVDLVPGQLTLMRIELFPFAHAFRKGSQIRMTVSGPGGASNAWPWAFDALPGSFQVNVAHDIEGHASSLVLPIVQPTDMRLPASLPNCDRVWLQPCRPED